MENLVNKGMIPMQPKDLYQLIISGLRYAYTRNNHLEPWTSFDRVREYLPIVEKIDEDWALKIAQQAAEECIYDQILIQFGDGVDDAYGNLSESIEFVRYLVDWISSHGKSVYMPYNWNRFVEFTSHK